MPRYLIKRSFFGKGNCLKYLLYDDGTVMFHFGVEKGDLWSWKKVKFNDVELGDILNVLEGKKDSASFFHSFENEQGQKVTTQISVNKKTDAKGTVMFIGVKELNKSLSEGEQRVLQALITHSLVRMNLML